MFHLNTRAPQGPENPYAQGMELLVSVVQRLSLAHDLESVVEIVRRAARQLTGADGATFVLRDDNQCYYVDEDAIEPLWKGKRFPMEACVSGWSILNREVVTIEDITQDKRIPQDAYRSTFVKSLALVPIRTEDPMGAMGAIGNYWARPHLATPEEVALLQALANSTSVALENIHLYSDLRKSLEDSRAARDELARQLSLRDEFISIGAHELKTPLTPLMIQTQFLQRLLKGGHFMGHPKEKDLTKITETIGCQVAEFNQRVEVLLDVSRIRLGHFTFEFHDGADLSEVLQRIANAHELAYPGKIHAEIQPGLQGCWDGFRLEQAITNLLSNAIRYGEQRPIEIRAQIEDDAFVQIIVRDQGVGVAKSDQIRIFERFERASSIRNFGGMGLGLFITRKIIEGHGGQIRLESAPGQGSTFTVRLPRKQDPQVKTVGVH